MFLKLFLAGVLVSQFTLSVDVDLAVFNVTVLDKDGRPVTGLTEKDFRIYEDGSEQQIKIFQPEDTPSTVGLVIDNSGSMTNKRKDVVEAGTAFVGASHPRDELFVVNFNRRTWLGLPSSLPFTSDRLRINSALSETIAQGTTALYDALKLSLQHLNKGSRQRKALVLLSDGGDNASATKLEEILQLAQQSSATIYCIGIYDPYQKDRNPSVLKKIAKVTGGEAFFPKNPASLQAVWPRIAGAIRSQYTIGYVSTNAATDGGYRRVKITATRRGSKLLDVRTRPGYVVGSIDP